MAIQSQNHENHDGRTGRDLFAAPSEAGVSVWLDDLSRELPVGDWLAE